MSRIFTIGTRKRCTNTLEEQAQRAIDKAKSTQEIALDDSIQRIEAEDYANAIIEINGVISNLQNAINNLNSAVTNINDGYYEQAIAQINLAISNIH